MVKDPIGFALSTMNRLAGNPWLDRLGLRKPVERLAFGGTRTGFQLLTASEHRYRQLRGLLPTRRLPTQTLSDRFDLNPSDDQQMIMDSLRRFAEDQIRPAAAKADEAMSVPEDVFRMGRDMGLVHYSVPEAFGGIAEVQSPLTSVMIAETLGWGDMGIAQALLASFGVAQVLTSWGNGRQQARYLPALSGAGDDGQPPALGTIAVDEPHPLFAPDHLHTRARRSARGFVLNGLKCAVPLAETADLLLVAAQLEYEGPRLFILERGLDGLAWRPDPSMGLRAAGLAQLALNDVALDNDALVGTGEPFDYQAFLDRASLMRSALATGCAQAVLDYVIPYCNQRVAFGEPISHRQSVAFMISDLAIELESMRLTLWRAASRAEQGLPFHREASLARLLSSEKSMQIASNGVQLLGGHGYVKEHPVERWYRDLRSTALLYGGLQA